MSELTTLPSTMEVIAAEVQNLAADPAELAERGRYDINFFASIMLPSVMVSPFPVFYVAIFKMLVNRTPEQMGRILRFALGLPRGHAKTTFIKVIIAWLIVYDKISFAVVLCATMPNAMEILADIDDMLSSDNSEQIYGRWSAQLTTDTKDVKKAHFHGRDVILVARGAESAIRGINIKHKRPDLILCDDAQTKECDDSPAESSKFRKRLVAMFKVIAPRGDRLIIYIGNMYSDTCILWQLKENSRWISLITGAILADGEPLWPSLHSLEELMDSYIHDVEMGEAEVWFAEVMNDPITKASSILTNPLPECPWTFEHERPDGVYLTIDPAGFRKHSDDNVIVVHYVFDGKPIIRHIDAGVKDPEQLIMQALRLALMHGASVIGIEDVAYQQTLLFWVNKYIIDWGLTNLEVVPLKHKNRSKEQRIRLFAAEACSGNYLIHRDALATWLWQAMKYKIGKENNKDDILDASAYGIDMRAEYWHLIKNNKVLALQSEADVVTDNTPF